MSLASLSSSATVIGRDSKPSSPLPAELLGTLEADANDVPPIKLLIGGASSSNRFVKRPGASSRIWIQEAGFAVSAADPDVAAQQFCSVLDDDDAAPFV